MKNDFADVFRRSSAVTDSRLSELGQEIQNQIDERNMIETKLKEASREPGIRYMLLSIDLPVNICTLLKFCGKVYLQFWWKSVLQEEKKSLQNLKPCFLHFLKTWALCKVNFVNTKKLLQMFTLCGLMCSLSPVSLIGRWASFPCRNGNLCVERKLDFCIFKQEKELETLSTRSAEQVADIRKLQAVVWYVTVTFSCHSYLKKQENIRVQLLKCHQLVLNSVFLLKVPNSIFSYMQKIFLMPPVSLTAPTPPFWTYMSTCNWTCLCDESIFLLSYPNLNWSMT